MILDFTGKLLRDAILSAAGNINNNKKMVDELNVFPVPDGDTGTNMSMTMNNAIPELKRMSDDITVGEVAQATASALLRGARGNSGVILSLLFRGLSKGLAGKVTANAYDIISAFGIGVDAAYKSVMKPTEGTILTVARVSVEEATKKVADCNDIVEVFAYFIEMAENTLNETPKMLPVLEKAGVVDAGGMGFLVILKGMNAVLNGEAVIESDDAPKAAAVVTNAAGSVENADIVFAYCTEYIVYKKKGCKDAMALRAFLESIGDCVVVVDDDDIIKVHVHSNHPGQAIEEGLKFGALTKMKIENMKEQHNNQLKEVEMTKASKLPPVKPEKDFGFVTVAAGQGIEDLFKDLGADSIVRGGQTMNPSTEDILEAVLATPAHNVFVLPNNKNIIMAAEQAVKLCDDRKVCVLQSRTIPQGISALMAFDPEADFSTNSVTMTEALDKVGSGQITFAVRDSDFEGHKIKQGEILAMENGKLTLIEKDVTKALVKLTKKLLKSGSSFVTVIYGSDVTDEAAQEAYDTLRAKISEDIDIVLVNGGQPVYYYIISVE